MFPAAVACIAVACTALGSDVPAGPGAVSAEHVKSIPCQEPGGGPTFTPLGLDFGIFGDLYVVDSDNSRILVLEDSLGEMSLFARCPEEFEDCRLIDIEAGDGAGMYVSEASCGSVLVYDRWGEYVSASGVGDGLTGIGIGKPEQVYAAMGIAGTVNIVELTHGGEPIECSIPGDDGGAYPVDCLVDKSGNVYVTDAFSGRVVVLSPLGKFRKALAGFDFSSPFGLASCAGRYLLVSDSERGAVAVFSPEGRFRGSFGEGVLETPAFITCRDDGVVCVADTGRMSIEVFKIEIPTR